MTEQNEGLLTPEEIEKAYEKGFDVEIKAYNLTEEIEMKRFEGRKFVAKAQVAKLTRLGWMSPDEWRERLRQEILGNEVAALANIEQAKREERERITGWVEDTDILTMLSPKQREEWQALKGGSK